MMRMYTHEMSHGWCFLYLWMGCDGISMCTVLSFVFALASVCQVDLISSHPTQRLPAGLHWDEVIYRLFWQHELLPRNQAHSSIVWPGHSVPGGD
jgi:hypothetical protein